MLSLAYSIPAAALPPCPLGPASTPLWEAVHNLGWSWDRTLARAVRDLNALDRERAENPIRWLREMADPAHPRQTSAGLERANQEAARFLDGIRASTATGPQTAYFCAEFGVHPSLPIYSGGLGVLAGDHLKSASDRDTALFGIGLFYHRGYFRQRIDAAGRQEHEDPAPRREELAMTTVLAADGAPLVVCVPAPGRQIRAAVRLARVGRVALLLLDTDHVQNAPSDRAITGSLYVSDRASRLYQELVLGVGGVRAIRALGLTPATWHLNEGHSALLLLERAGERLASGAAADTAQALDQVAATSVFTIHTPVPAGNERFEQPLFRRLAGPAIEAAGLDADAIAARGAGASGDTASFDMTAFCLRTSRHQNGVSQLHGKVASGTWSTVLGRDIPGLTNGVHAPTWLGARLLGLLHDRGVMATTRDPERTADALHEALAAIPNAELWEARRGHKAALLAEARARLTGRAARIGAPPEALSELSGAFDSEALTIGFARRFATYKRATLVLSDPDRLAAILGAAGRPVQIFFAGKAHPADRPGQALIADILTLSEDPRFRGRIAFLEGYDLPLGHALVTGVDVWLNNPLRPMEASGTSGMKAAMNGGLNVSVLDGWWDEAFAPGLGWAIGPREDRGIEPSAEEKRVAFARDAEALYTLLEREVVPTYYDRDDDGVPTRWLAMARRSIAASLDRFSARRMVAEYERVYAG